MELEPSLTDVLGALGGLDGLEGLDDLEGLDGLEGLDDDDGIDFESLISEIDEDDPILQPADGLPNNDSGSGLPSAETPRISQQQQQQQAAAVITSRDRPPPSTPRSRPQPQPRPAASGPCGTGIMDVLSPYRSVRGADPPRDDGVDIGVGDLAVGELDIYAQGTETGTRWASHDHDCHSLGDSDAVTQNVRGGEFGGIFAGGSPPAPAPVSMSSGANVNDRPTALQQQDPPITGEDANRLVYLLRDDELARRPQDMTPQLQESSMPRQEDNGTDALAAALGISLQPPQPQKAGSNYIIAINQSNKTMRYYFTGSLDPMFQRPAVEAFFGGKGWRISENKKSADGLRCYRITDEIIQYGDTILSQRQTSPSPAQTPSVPMKVRSQRRKRVDAETWTVRVPSPASSSSFVLRSNPPLLRGDSYAQPVSSSSSPTSVDIDLIAQFKTLSLDKEPVRMGGSTKPKYNKMPLAPPHLLVNDQGEMYINIYSYSASDDTWERDHFEEGAEVLWFKDGTLRRVSVKKVHKTKAGKQTGEYDPVPAGSGKKSRARHEDLFLAAVGLGDGSGNEALDGIMKAAKRSGRVCDPVKGKYEKRSFAPPFVLMNTRPAYEVYVNAYSAEGSSWRMKEFDAGSRAFWLNDGKLKSIEIDKEIDKKANPRDGYTVKVLCDDSGSVDNVAHHDLFVIAAVKGGPNPPSGSEIYDEDFTMGRGGAARSGFRLHDLGLLARYFDAAPEPPFQRPRDPGMVYKSDVLAKARLNEGKFWYKVHVDSGGRKYWGEEVNQKTILKIVTQKLRDKKGELEVSKFCEVMGISREVREKFEKELLPNSNKLRLFEQIKGKKKGVTEISPSMVKLVIFSKGTAEECRSGVTKMCTNDDLRGSIEEEIQDTVHNYLSSHIPAEEEDGLLRIVVKPSFEKLLTFLNPSCRPGSDESVTSASTSEGVGGSISSPHYPPNDLSPLPSPNYSSDAFSQDPSICG